MSKSKDRVSSYPSDIPSDAIRNLYGDSILHVGADIIKNKIIKKYQGLTRAALATSLLVSGSFSVSKAATEMVHDNLDQISVPSLRIPEIPDQLPALSVPDLRPPFETAIQAVRDFAEYNYYELTTMGVYNITCPDAQSRRAWEFPYVRPGSPVCGEGVLVKNVETVAGYNMTTEELNGRKIEAGNKDAEVKKNELRMAKMNAEVSKLLWGLLLIGGGVRLSKNSKIDKEVLRDRIKSKLIQGVVFGISYRVVDPSFLDSFFKK